MRVRETIMLVCLVALGFTALGSSTRAQQPGSVPGATAAATPSAESSPTVAHLPTGSTGGSSTAPATTSPQATSTAPVTGTSTTPPPSTSSSVGNAPPTTTAGDATATTPPPRRVPSLGLAVTSPPAALVPFRPGSEARSTGVVTITSSSAWTLRVSDGGGSSPAPGHLLRSGRCTQGVAFLRRPLEVTAMPQGGAGDSAGAGRLGGAAVAVASGGAGVVAVTVRLAQFIDADEQIRAGCGYALTLTYTVS